jgi:hypothetical protein
VGEQGNGCGFLFPLKLVNGADKDESSGDSTSPNTDSDQRWNLTLNKSQSSSPFVPFITLSFRPAERGSKHFTKLNF